MAEAPCSLTEMPLFQSFSVQQTLSQRQTLAQWMAMRQSPILELSQEGLWERQLEELRTNPVVERIPASVPVVSTDALRAEASSGPSLEGASSVPDAPFSDALAPLTLGEEGASLFQKDVGDFFYNTESTEYSPEAEERRTFWMDSIRANESLEEHLLYQVSASALSARDAELALSILQSLDARGYLSSPLADVAQSCGSSQADAERVLRIVQSFDPIGMAARTLAERFLLQLEAEGLGDVLAADFLREKPELFRSREIRSTSLFRSFQMGEQEVTLLMRHFECTKEEVLLALSDIDALDPSPEDAFIPRDQDIITADATVVEREGRFVVLGAEPSDGTASGGEELLFRVNPEFEALAGDASTEPSFRDELKHKIAQAEELAATIRGRHEIVLAVASAIVARQQDFFAQRSLAALHPMTQRDLAQDLSTEDRQFDESQISRACNGKWMKTPFGNLKFSDFFSRGVSGKSNRSIKDRVRQLIEAEDASQPLSDSAVSKLLAEEGITLSREGVKKYRNELHIPSSTQRKNV